MILDQIPHKTQCLMETTTTSSSPSKSRTSMCSQLRAERSRLTPRDGNGPILMRLGKPRLREMSFANLKRSSQMLIIRRDTLAITYLQAL